MVLFDDGAREVDTGVAYRPPWYDLHRPLEAWQCILTMLASPPDRAPFERFLPPMDAGNDSRSRHRLRRRAAWARPLAEQSLDAGARPHLAAADGSRIECIRTGALSACLDSSQMPRKRPGVTAKPVFQTASRYRPSPPSRKHPRM